MYAFAVQVTSRSSKGNPTLHAWFAFAVNRYFIQIGYIANLDPLRLDCFGTSVCAHGKIEDKRLVSGWHREPLELVVHINSECSVNIPCGGEMGHRVEYPEGNPAFNFSTWQPVPVQRFVSVCDELYVCQQAHGQEKDLVVYFAVSNFHFWQSSNFFIWDHHYER